MRQQTVEKLTLFVGAPLYITGEYIVFDGALSTVQIYFSPASSFDEPAPIVALTVNVTLVPVTGEDDGVIREIVGASVPGLLRVSVLLRE